MFLDAIGEVVHPTRVAILVPDAMGREFRIAANRGLAPQLVQGIRLSADDGLMRWLTVQGRPAPVGEMTDPEILRELKLLQAVVAVPLLAHGELVAVLALGQPVFGTSYGRREMQTLFDLAAGKTENQTFKLVPGGVQQLIDVVGESATRIFEKRPEPGNLRVQARLRGCELDGGLVFGDGIQVAVGLGIRLGDDLMHAPGVRINFEHPPIAAV